ncbi:MAG: hypothetical protein RMJ32_03385 [Aquificaceae bacterium]|nr:hypothetical protein [Aquificaceae bacterium]
MKAFKSLAPALGAFLISCGADNALITDPNQIVKEFNQKVIYGKDFNSCVKIVSNHVYTGVIFRHGILPTKEQAKAVCKEYIDIARSSGMFSMHGIKDFEVSGVELQDGRYVASLFLVKEDGSKEPAGNFVLRKVNNRWVMEL